MAWRYRDTVLALCTLAFFVTMVGRLAISPVVPAVTETFDVSNALVGMALTGMWLTYALGQYPSGVLADRYGDRLVILVSVGGTGAMGLLVVFAPNFALFFLGTLMIGAAAGLHYSVATALLARTYDNIGTAIGIHNAGAPVAGLLTPIVVSWVAVRYGWRPAVAVTAVVAVPVFVLFAWLVKPTSSSDPGEGLLERISSVPARELLTRPKIVFTGVVAVIFDFVWQGVASFLPTFLVVYHGYSTTTAGALFAAYFIVQGALQIGVGQLSDRFGRDAATAVCGVLGIVAFGLLIAPSGGATIGLGIVLLGAAMGWGAAVLPRFMDHLSPSERRIGFGLIRTTYMIVAAAGSFVVGLLADLFGWAVSFGFLLVLLGAICCLLAVNWAFDLGY